MFRKLIEYLGAVVLIGAALMMLLGAIDPAFGAAPRVSLPSPYVLDASTIAYVDCKRGMGTALYLGAGI